MHFIGGPTVVLKITRHRNDISARHTQRFAGIACFNLRHFFGVFNNQFTKAHQNATTLRRRHLAPRAIQGPLRRGDGQVDIGYVTAIDLRKRFTVARIDQVNRLTAHGSNPFAFD